LSAPGSSSFPRNQRLKSKKVSELVFANGLKLKAPPIIVRYLDTPLSEPVATQVMVTVSKKKFKRAVDRNRIKRLMREAWRLQKVELENQLVADEKQRAIVFIFVASEMPNYEIVRDAMASLVEKMLLTKPDQD
jgi:ribonuclease P protein component